MSTSPHEDVAKVLVDEQELERIVERIAGEITADYRDSNPLIVGVLIGSFVFMADLVRRLDFPLEVDFMAASSYGEGTTPGVLTVTRDLGRDVAGRHVLLVDDILDTGRTLRMLTGLLTDRGAAGVATCCALDKPSRREVDFQADYVGAEIPDVFAVGYGLDCAYAYRNLPYVGALRRELYENGRAG